MRINKKIKIAANFNPTKKSHQLSILDMCQLIHNNKMTLPLYQRDLSWNLQKAVDLFNYQLFGKAPISPISINEISDSQDPVPQISFIDRELIPHKIISAAHQSVIDGQQRLSTNYKAYVNHDDFKNIYLDVSSAKFKLVTTNYKESQIPVGILLNKDKEKLLKFLVSKNLVSDLYPTLVDVRSKIMSYNYTLNVASDLSEDEQIEWFQVLNNAGSRVSSLQMAFSKLKLYDFDIYSDYVTPFKKLVNDFGFEELFSPFTTNVSYPVASLNSALELLYKKSHRTNFAPIPSDTKENLISNLEIKELKYITKMTLECAEKALNFLANNNLSSAVSRIDYILYVTGYFVFNSNPTQDELNGLTQWVQKISFTNKSNGSRRKIFDELILNNFNNTEDY